MTRRMVILRIDDLVALLRDFTHLPSDVRAVKLMVNPQEQGKIGVVVESDEIKHGAAPLHIHFDLKRVYSV